MSNRLAIASVLACTSLAPAADAGTIAEQFRGGAFGVSWAADANAVQARYPQGAWQRDEQGNERYCAASRQPLLKLPAQHQTREICFVMGADGTVTTAIARLDATLPSLLAIVNRARTLYGDFDAVRRDQGSIQSRYTYMLWTRDRPYVVQVGSRNDANGAPSEVTFTVGDDVARHTSGADAVSNRPVAANR
jgi:hypothetical protein